MNLVGKRVEFMEYDKARACGALLKDGARYTGTFQPITRDQYDIYVDFHIGFEVLAYDRESGFVDMRKLGTTGYRLRHENKFDYITVHESYLIFPDGKCCKMQCDTMSVDLF